MVGSSHRNSGQTCICTNRVLVHVSAACRLLKQLMGRAVLLALPLLLPSLQAGMHACCYAALPPAHCCTSCLCHLGPCCWLLPLLQEKVHDEFVEMLTQRVSALRLGSGMEPGTTQGPLISAAAVDRVGCAVVAAGWRRC